MLRFLKTIFGIYALIVFASTLIVAFICYVIVFNLFNKKRAIIIAHKYISRPWAGTAFFLFGIRVKVINGSLTDPKQTYVFIANHKSQLDIPAYALVTKHTIRFLAKAELGKIPLLGFIIRRLYLMVDRNDKADRLKSMENMKQSLSDGISVFICPEGTRNKSGEPLLPFRDGAFRLAIAAQVPIAALVISNTDELLSPLHPIELRPGTIKCKWCPPVATIGMTEENIPELKEKIVRMMLEELNSIGTR